MENKSEIYKGIQKLYDEAVLKEPFKFKNNILLKYLTIQESLPFEVYFKNQFVRLIEKDSLKKHLFLKKGKEDSDIVNYLIVKIKNEQIQKLQNIIKSDNSEINNPERLNEKNFSNSMAENAKKSKKDNKNAGKSNAQKNSISMIENINNKIYNINNIEKSKDKKHFNSMNKSTNNKNNCIINIEKSNDEGNNNSHYKSDYTNQSKNSNCSSNLSFNMNVIQEKLKKKEIEIEEIISQKEFILQQLIKENNESNNNMLSYFVDTNNLSGEQFERSGIKYIFQLIKCISVKQDFCFYYNVVISPNNLNTVFNKYKLIPVEKVQLDFVISDLKIGDFINMLIYLYPNILNLDNLKKNPFKKEMDFDSLINLRNQYIKSNEKIDVFGEVGQNIFNEEEKIEQLIKYRKIIYNINQLIKINAKEVDEILDKFKMKKNNKKLILFLTNGEYSKIFGKDFSKEKIIKAQNEYDINSLIIYLNNNINSQERNYIDNLILNYDLSKGKNKFIEQLINLKKQKLTQLKINDKFKSISFKLNNFENKLRAIEKDYASFLKKANKNLMMNELISVFFKNKSAINENINFRFNELEKIKLNESIKFDCEINIILFHQMKVSTNQDIFSSLKNNKIKIEVYDLSFDPEDILFSSFEKIKNVLIQKKNKKIYIIIFSFTNMDDITFLNQFSQILITNSLSYLYIISKNEIRFDFSAFHDKHIYVYKYSNDVENKIKEDIRNKLELIANNYRIFSIYYKKYNRIIDEYNKCYKYTLLTSESNHIKEEKTTFEDLIDKHTQLLIEKISQDISFILSLTTQKKNNLNNKIEKDIKEIISNNNENIISSFFDQETITSELSNILNNFIKTLKENSNNCNYMDFNEKEINIEYDNEIMSIDGIQKIYEDDIVDKIIENESSIDEDKGKDILNNDSINKFDIKEDNQIKNEEKHTENEETFKINFLIQEVKDTLAYSIKLINLKLYYKYFLTGISKIFKNKVERLISDKVVEKEIN